MDLYLLSDSLVNVFSSSGEAILLLDVYMVAIMKNDIEYFFFDSHECDKSGIPDVTETGADLLIKFSNLHQLATHICTLANKLKTQKFEIIPVKISHCSVESNNCLLRINESENFTSTTQEISNDVNSENMQKQYKLKNLDQEKAKQKAYYLKQQRNESLKQKEKRLARNREYRLKNLHLEPKIMIPVNKIWSRK